MTVCVSSVPGVIVRWWQRWPTANVAVRTGAVSGLVVLDVDPDHGGLATLAELQQTHGGLPPSPAVRTGSGGRHDWFAHPGDHVRNSAGLLGPGLDVRGDGGYVIAPPSVHAAGNRYVWASEVVLAPVPAWLLARCRERDQIVMPPASTQYRPQQIRAWAAAAFESELGRLRRTTEGSRNHTLNRAAFALGQLVGARHLEGDIVRDALVAAGVGIGLTAKEVRATVASGLRAGLQTPRSPSSLPNDPTLRSPSRRDRSPRSPAERGVAADGPCGDRNVKGESSAPSIPSRGSINGR